MTRAPARILAVVACACLFAVCALAGGAPPLSTTQPSQPAASTVPADLRVGVPSAPRLPVPAGWRGHCSPPWPALNRDSIRPPCRMREPTVSFSSSRQPSPSTPNRYRPGGATPATPFDPVDAAYAAGRYLCALGVVENPTLALVAYNCGNPGPTCQAASAGYAEQVLATAAGYTTPGVDEPNAVQGAVGATDRLRRVPVTLLVGLVG